MSQHIPAGLKLLVTEPADGLCEYCQLPQSSQESTFHIDHVQSQTAKGLTPFPKEIANIFTSDSELIKWEREEYQKVAPDPTRWSTLFDKALKSGIEWRGLSNDELKAIKAPVLIACGDHDLVPVERCAELSRLIPNAQLAVIPDASHFVLFSAPEKLLPTIDAFLDAPDLKVPLSTMKTGYYPGATR